MSLEAENLPYLDSEAKVTIEEKSERHSVSGFEEGAVRQGICAASRR